MRCYRLCKDEKSIVESCLDKKYSDRVKILKNVGVLYYTCWWCYEGVERIDEASLLETFGNLKMRSDLKLKKLYVLIGENPT